LPDVITQPRQALINVVAHSPSPPEKAPLPGALSCGRGQASAGFHQRRALSRDDTFVRKLEPPRQEREACRMVAGGTRALDAARRPEGLGPAHSHSVECVLNMAAFSVKFELLLQQFSLPGSDVTHTQYASTCGHGHSHEMLPLSLWLPLAGGPTALNCQGSGVSARNRGRTMGP
jgi:hypothetical protein